MTDEEDRVQLLHNIRANMESLENLLQKVSQEWTYEDCVYRFYHYSFKVFFCQHTTRDICSALQNLLPDRKLNDTFMAIINAGTWQGFDIERSNKNWLTETRPIVEAFMHAKFMLEMAVKYGKKLESVNELPIGWAALLYLYNLR